MFSDYVAHFARHLKSQARSAATIESYCRDAQQFLNWLKASNIDLDRAQSDYLVEFQQNMLDQGIRKNSLRRQIIGIRQFYRFLEERELIRTSPFDGVPIPHRIEKLPPPLTQEEFLSLVKVAREQSYKIKAQRDVLILHLLAYEGLKTNEIIHLERSQILFDQENTMLRIGGSHQRQILCTPETSAAIKEFFEALQELENQSPVSTKLLIGFKGKGHPAPHGQLTRHGLKFLLYELGHAIGLDALNAEALRHFAIDHLKERGLSANEIMEHLGLKQLGIIAQHFHPARSVAAKATWTPSEGQNRAI